MVSAIEQTLSQATQDARRDGEEEEEEGGDDAE
jgi:hypothetical protein